MPDPVLSFKTSSRAAEYVYVQRDWVLLNKRFFFIFWLGLKPVDYGSNICLITIIDLIFKRMQKLFKIMTVVISKIPYLS